MGDHYKQKNSDGRSRIDSHVTLAHEIMLTSLSKGDESCQLAVSSGQERAKLAAASFDLAARFMEEADKLALNSGYLEVPD